MPPGSRGAYSGDSRTVERRARWVLDTIGARELGFGDDVPSAPRRGSRSSAASGREGDELAEAFFHLARVEERDGAAGRARPLSGRVVVSRPARPAARAAAGASWGSSRRAGAAPVRRRADARRGRAVEVDRDRRQGSGSASEARPHRRAGRAGAARAARRSPAPPSTRCAAPIRTGASTGSSRTNGAAGRRLDVLPARRPRARARRRRGRGVRAAAAAARRDAPDGGGRDRAARQLLGRRRRGAARATRRSASSSSAGPVQGQRYHYLRVDPHRNLGSLEARLRVRHVARVRRRGRLPGGIAHPFRPWDFERDAPHDLVEVPLAAMDVTLFAERYLNLSVDEAEPQLHARCSTGPRSTAAASRSSGTPSSTTRRSCPGWDVLYRRVIEDVRARGGACVQAGALAEEARAWLS